MVLGGIHWISEDVLVSGRAVIVSTGLGLPACVCVSVYSLLVP